MGLVLSKSKHGCKGKSGDDLLKGRRRLLEMNVTSRRFKQGLTLRTHVACRRPSEVLQDDPLPLQSRNAKFSKEDEEESRRDSAHENLLMRLPVGDVFVRL